MERQLFTEADKSRFIKTMFDKWSGSYDTLVFNMYDKALRNSDSPGERTEDMVHRAPPSCDTLIKVVNSGALDQYKIDWNRTGERETFKKLIFAYFDNQFRRTLKDLKKPNWKNFTAKVQDESLFSVIYEDDTWILFCPKTWEAAVWIDSVGCGGAGAKWCIGYAESSDYWIKYARGGSKFCCALNKKKWGHESELKYMLQLRASNPKGFKIAAWVQDDNPENCFYDDELSSYIDIDLSLDELVEKIDEALDNASAIRVLNYEEWFDDPYDFIVDPGEDGNVVGGVLYLIGFNRGSCRLLNIEALLKYCQNPEVLDTIYIAGNYEESTTKRIRSPYQGGEVSECGALIIVDAVFGKLHENSKTGTRKMPNIVFTNFELVAIRSAYVDERRFDRDSSISIAGSTHLVIDKVTLDIDTPAFGLNQSRFDSILNDIVYEYPTSGGFTCNRVIAQDIGYFRCSDSIKSVPKGLRVRVQDLNEQLAIHCDREDWVFVDFSRFEEIIDEDIDLGVYFDTKALASHNVIIMNLNAPNNELKVPFSCSDLDINIGFLNCNIGFARCKTKYDRACLSNLESQCRKRIIIEDENMNESKVLKKVHRLLTEASKERFIKPYFDEWIHDLNQAYDELGLPAEDWYEAPRNDEEIQKLISWCDTPSASGIDWNLLKSQFTNSDFAADYTEMKKLLIKYITYKKEGGSRKEKKSKRTSFSDESKYMVLPIENKNWLFVVPRTYEAAKYMDSAECGGQPARWCIGYEDSSQYWDEYTEDAENIFILAVKKQNAPDIICPEDYDAKDTKLNVTIPARKYMIQFKKSRPDIIKTGSGLIRHLKGWRPCDNQYDTLTGEALCRIFDILPTHFNKILEDLNEKREEIILDNTNISWQNLLDGKWDGKTNIDFEGRCFYDDLDLSEIFKKYPDSDAIITFSGCEISDLIVQDAGSPSKLMFSFEGCRIGTAYLHPLSGSPRGDTEVGFINCKIYEAQYSDLLEDFDEDDDPDGLLVSELWRRVYDNGSYSFTRTEIRDERYV